MIGYLTDTAKGSSDTANQVTMVTISHVVSNLNVL